jgi:dihydroflavonol-4-reductase
MRVFVTGASGFIGTYTIRRLAQTEHQLCCLVRKTSRIQELEKHGVTIVTGDVTDKASLCEGMKGCDWVVNLANVYSFWVADKTLYRRVNVEGTRNVMECALDAAVSKVVHVSTALVFGKPADIPFTEESSVGTVLFSDYAQSKYEGDLVAWELYEKRGLPLVMIYPGLVVGAGDPKSSGQYIDDFIHRRVPVRVIEGSILTFVHVADVAEAIVRALEKENNLGEKYLLGTYQLPFGEYSKLISEISGVPLPKRRFPHALIMPAAWLRTRIANVTKHPPTRGMSTDQMRSMKEGVRFDGSKAERELGITYTPIRVAIEEAIASYRGK